MPLKDVQIGSTSVEVRYMFDKGDSKIKPCIQIWDIVTNDVFELLRQFDIIKENGKLQDPEGKTIGLLDYIENILLKEYI